MSTATPARPPAAAPPAPALRQLTRSELRLFLRERVGLI